MNTPAGSYVRRSVYSCAVPLLVIPVPFVILAAVARQFPITTQAILNSLLLVYGVAFVCVLVAWATVLLPAMLWISPQSSIWRAAPAVCIGMGIGVLSMLLACGIPQLPGTSLADAFFLLAPFLSAGAAVGFLAHRSMTPRA